MPGLIQKHFVNQEDSACGDRAGLTKRICSRRRMLIPKNNVIEQNKKNEAIKRAYKQPDFVKEENGLRAQELL